ncbi:class I SAM-dependent methyltransferase [Paroceanicella profunda]|uniref:Class I SAM-dependent methyltransferase n=1 Tax=Paroceanicella profunda TaxID=2579971 RepID=A0A5B8G0P6_9RHOB|nr:SAM-dependent methyltransferase [Paroceanicella profunda]QDL92003.1 class I SAM-dependent methyltransferase [Paroceanicella profunda]
MSLREILARRIAREGPMPLSEYMGLCLAHPQFGYYPTRDPLGAAGDFTTAPEISQIFGEMLGLALAEAWIARGRPTPFVLAELGPGRGTLMADVLRATARVPGFHAAARPWLVETSPALRAAQGHRLAGFAPHWADTVADLPDLPLFLLANEFFDALPIRQFRSAGPAGWAESMVGLEGERLTLGLAPPVAMPRFGTAPEGVVREICPAGEAVAAALGARLAARGGLALAIDYGGWDGEGDTFQALRGHAVADPLDSPGQADLTAHVDFAALAAAATGAGARVAGFTPQGEYLMALGAGARAEALAARADAAGQEALRAQLTRLVSPEQMGRLFKVLALTGPHDPPPPGFEGRE